MKLLCRMLIINCTNCLKILGGQSTLLSPPVKTLEGTVPPCPPHDLRHCRIRSSNYLGYSRFHCSKTYSNSRFNCSETRVIFIAVYVAVITLVIPASIAVKLIVIPASIAVKHASFSSPDTLQHVLIVIPASIAVKTRHYISYSRFHCIETRVILINGYIEGTPPNIPASI